MTKEEFEKLKSTVKQWLFHIGTLDPIEYANELRINFIEPREKQIEKLKKENAELKQQIEKMKRCEICEHHLYNGCNYHSLWVKDCKENEMKLFKLKEVEK